MTFSITSIYKIVLGSICLSLFFSCKNEVNFSHLEFNKLRLTDSLVIKLPDSIYPGEVYWDFNKVGDDEFLFNANFPLSKIYPYNISKNEWLEVMDYSSDGPNGVGMATGFYVKNFDSTYIFSGYNHIINLFKYDSIIIKKDNIFPDFDVNLFLYRKAKYVENTLFLPGTDFLNYDKPEGVNKGKVLLKYNVLTGENEAIINFPDEYKNRVWSKEYVFAPFIINDNHLIISYAKSPYIYKYDLDGNLVSRHDAHSKYVSIPDDLGKNADSSGEKAKNIYYENGFYNYLFYDQENQLYYRIAKHLSLQNKTSQDTSSLNHMDISIVVLDEDLNYLGETELLDKSISGFYAFMSSKGLCLSIKPSANKYKTETQVFKIFNIEDI